ncbi:MAG: hypothetical protein CM1200mP9_07020 [Gammaproteobacteria bacterium]|nr:MAG: hypothetical protein CM1200mP9_07020 [Gammaproteobacteria bacterium]
MRLGRASFSFDGLIKPQTINRVLAPYELLLTGGLELKSVKATGERNESQVVGSKGISAGTVGRSVPHGNQRHQRELPALLGNSKRPKGIPSITIRSERKTHHYCKQGSTMTVGPHRHH